MAQVPDIIKQQLAISLIILVSPQDFLSTTVGQNSLKSLVTKKIPKFIGINNEHKIFVTFKKRKYFYIFIFDFFGIFGPLCPTQLSSVGRLLTNSVI